MTKSWKGVFSLWFCYREQKPARNKLFRAFQSCAAESHTAALKSNCAILLHSASANFTKPRQSLDNAAAFSIRQKESSLFFFFFFFSSPSRTERRSKSSFVVKAWGSNSHAVTWAEPPTPRRQTGDDANSGSIAVTIIAYCAIKSSLSDSCPAS